MSEDERYLRDLSYPQDAWVLSGQQWYTAVEVGKYLGISDDAARKLAEGARVPGAILHDRRIGSASATRQLDRKGGGANVPPFGTVNTCRAEVYNTPLTKGRHDA
jgi:hypothetical protein